MQTRVWSAYGSGRDRIQPPQVLIKSSPWLYSATALASPWLAIRQGRTTGVSMIDASLAKPRSSGHDGSRLFVGREREPDDLSDGLRSGYQALSRSRNNRYPLYDLSAICTYL